MDDDDDSSLPPPPAPVMQHDPMQHKIEEAIRKAKLLARIDQLEARGVRPSKKFTYRAAEDELITEVAKMESLAQRSTRIKQGRSAFIMLVGSMEKGANWCDDSERLPVKCYLKGFTKQTVKDITNYDDCLERGVESMFGSADALPWYVQLGLILGPAMITHHMMQRFKDDPEHTRKVLRSDPELRNEVARELAREMNQSERDEARKVTERLAKAQQEQQQKQAEAQRHAAMSAPPPGTRMSAPPPPSSSLAVPEQASEYIPPNPVQTREMALEMQRNEAIVRQRREMDAQQRRIQELEAKVAGAAPSSRAIRADESSGSLGMIIE